MKSKAYTKYYLAHRDELLAKMRERDAVRRADLSARAETDPELAETLREKYRDKYHRRIANSMLKKINEWLADDKILDSFKEFLRTSVLANDAYKKMTMKSLTSLANLNILRVLTPLQMLTMNSNGATDGSEDEGTEA
jgi:hypothetical protein